MPQIGLLSSFRKQLGWEISKQHSYKYQWDIKRSLVINHLLTSDNPLPKSAVTDKSVCATSLCCQKVLFLDKNYINPRVFITYITSFSQSRSGYSSLLHNALTYCHVKPLKNLSPPSGSILSNQKHFQNVLGLRCKPSSAETKSIIKESSLIQFTTTHEKRHGDIN